MSFMEDVQFPGEVPLPGPIGPAISGDSRFKANADHSHPFFIDPWTGLSFLGAWTNFGAGYRTAGYYILGNFVFLRGVISGGGIGLSNAATLAAEAVPSETELFIINDIVGLRVEVGPGGFLTVLGHAALADPVPLSGMWWAVG